MHMALYKAKLIHLNIASTYQFNDHQFFYKIDYKVQVKANHY